MALFNSENLLNIKGTIIKNGAFFVGIFKRINE